MSNLSPTLLSRSLAFIIYLPSNRKVLGKHIMGNTVVEAVSEFIGFIFVVIIISKLMKDELYVSFVSFE